MKHCIFCHEPFNLNKGGVVGYLSQLYQAMLNERRLTTNSGIDLSFLFPIDPIKPNEYPRVKKPAPEFEYLFSNDFPNLNMENKLGFIGQRNFQFRSVLPYSEIRKIDFNNIKSIHIHGAYNFAPVYNTLFKYGLHNKIVKVLSTHNPYMPTIEDMELITRDLKWTEAQKEIIRYFFSERDKLAFSLADALVFPAKESMEQYYKLWPEFKDIIKDKRIYFCETGSKPKQQTSSVTFLKEKLGIPEDAILFLYLGRFVKVRGYDLLTSIAQRIFDKNEKIYFLIVGEERKVQINSPRWIQIPHTNFPGDYLAMADVVLAPNRGSYFDLSMIESLAAGRALLCSDVGGYKWLHEKTSGVCFFKPEDLIDIEEKILSMASLGKEKLAEMGLENRKLYDARLTPKNFVDNYMSVIDKIYRDFSIHDGKNEYILPSELTFNDKNIGLGLVKPRVGIKGMLSPQNKDQRALLIAKYLENTFGLNSPIYRFAKKVYWRFLK